MTAARVWCTIVVLSVASLALLWLSDVPLGIPGEWTWQRIPVDSLGGEMMLAIVEIAIAGVVLLLLFWSGLNRVGRCSQRELAVWLLGLTGAGFAWLSTVQNAAPPPWDSGRIPFVVYYPGISGYFYKARYEIDDAAEFLANYEELMAEGDVLHVGTHPPGLFLLYRGLWLLTDASPVMREVAEATMPESVQDSFAIVEANIRARGQLLSSADRATIWLAAAITQLFCAASVVPLFVLMRQAVSRQAAWRAVMFWPLLPALAVFLPKSDVLFVFPAASLLAIWLLAVQKRSVMLGAIAGAIGWCGLLMSLAFLPIGLIALLGGIAAARMLVADDGQNPVAIAQSMRSLLRPVAGGIAVFVVLTVGLALLADVNLGRVWLLNYRNHAGFYSQFDRTWWKWLLVNPIELAFACGVPVAVMATASVCRSLSNVGEPKVRLQSLGAVFVWSLLWLSGKNSGEAARLWIPLLPVLTWQLAAWFERSSDSSETSVSLRNPADRNWLILLTLQMAVCSLTALRVTGFHFNAGPPLP
jgi:hypothetical protein